MTVVVINPPADNPVSLAEAKAQVGEESGDRDDLLEGYIAAATAWLDGPGGWLGRALVTQTLELRAGGFPTCHSDEIDLPYPPVASITSITYASPTDGSDIVLDMSAYRHADGVLAPAYGLAWPDYRAQRSALRIRYEAGYGEPDAVPAPIKQAILLLVSQWYAAREPVGPNTEAELPFAVSALLSPYRVWRA